MRKLSSGWGASAFAVFLSLMSLSASGSEPGTYFTQPPGGAFEVEVPGGAGVQLTPNRLRMMADPRGTRGEGSAIEVVFEGAADAPLEPRQRIDGDLIYWYSGAIGDPALAVPRFAALEQKDLHPGIDRAVMLQQGRIEQRFTLASGASLTDLRLRVRTRGSQPVLTASGALAVGDVLFQPAGASFVSLGEDLYGLAAAGSGSEVALHIDYAAWLVEVRSTPLPRLADHPNLLAQLPGANPGDLLVFRTGTPPAPPVDSAVVGGGVVYSGGDYACGSIVLGPGDTLDPSGGAFTNVLALVLPAGVTAGVAPGGSLLDVTAAYVRIDGMLDLRGAGEAGGPAVPGTGTSFATSPGLPGQGPGGGQGGSGGAFFDEVAGSGGGGYGNLGGAGGASDEPGGVPGAGGGSYGMALPPGIEPGSGGASGVANAGASGAGGAGGGALDLLGNDIRIGGLIRADGAGGGSVADDAAGGAGGAGGGVLLQASRTLFGNGTVAARGGGAGAGDSFAGGSGGGAGGRIKFTGALDPGSTITSLVSGGGGYDPFIGGAGAAGGPGSIDTSTTTPPNPAGADVTVCGVAVAELRLTKTVDTPVVSVGDTVVYTLLVENIGFTNATGITVVDALPAGMTAVSTSGCINDPNGSASCQLPDLAPGASAGYTLTATVVLDPGQGMTDTITNTAVVDLAETDPDPTDSQASATFTVLGDPLLTLTKVGPPTAIAGQTVTYTIEVSNGGPQDALDVVINDTPPAGLSFNSATAPCAGGFPCAIGTLADGANVQFDVTFDIASNVLGDVTNTANVTASNVAVPNPAVNSDSAITTIQAVADLSISKADSVDPVVAGTPLSYTVTVNNDGPSDATVVTVADTLPAGVTFVSTTGCTQDPAGVPTCSLGTIAAGGMAAYTINVNVSPATPAGVINNTAVVSSAATDPNPANDSATEPTTVQVVADLTISKTNGVASSIPGTDTVYTIVVGNAGPSNAPGSTVADVFPAACVGVTWSCVGAGGGTCTANGAGNINDVVNLPASGSVTYSATCPIDPAALGTLTNTATVTAAGGVSDPNGANNSATDSDALDPIADLTISKTNGVASSIPGTDTVYTIVVGNAGPSNAPGSSVADVFPAACVGVTWSCVGAGGGTCTANGAGNINDVVNLPASGNVTYSATCPIDPAALGTLANTATVTAAGGVSDPNGANNSATDSDTLDPIADLTISKTNGVASSIPGADTVYTIVVGNVGPSNAPGSTMADVFPPACVGVTWSCVGAGGGTCTANGAGNINDVVNLPASGSVTFSATCPIDPAALGTLANTATVTAPGGVPDPNGANNSATDSDTLVASADLSITKAAVGVPTPTLLGSTFSYTLTVSNAGPSTATSVVVTDLLPATVDLLSNDCGAVYVDPTLTWTIGTMAPGASLVCNLNVVVAEFGPIVNTASLVSATADPDGANNASTSTLTGAEVTDVAITLTSNVMGNLAVGQSFVYTVTGTNNGPGVAFGLDFILELPGKVSFVSSTCGAVLTGTTLSWTVPTLASGASASCDITVVVVLPGDIQATANVTSVTFDPDLSNNSAELVVSTGAIPIPTFGTYGLLLLSLLLGGIGVAVIRRA